MKLPRCRPLVVAWVGAVAALSLLAAGCGGAGSPKVANLTTSTTATTPPRTGVVAYARCMRSHGVPTFPDPNGGSFDGTSIKQLRIPKGQLRAADSHCIHLLPNGVVPSTAGYTITRADQLDYLKGASCMRRHGIPNFPDPTFQNNGVKFNIPSSINPNSPVVLHALPICQKLIPAGLPYSGTN